MKSNEYKREIDEFLKSYFKNKGSFNKVIYDSMAYSLNIGGKRVRPILMLMTYRLFREDYRNILPLAASMEMIHTYSLIHDDLPAMDDDDLRRGKPTNHKVYGEAIAILAGDGLLNEAMICMLSAKCIDSDLLLKASKEMFIAAGADGMIGGQVVDIINEGKEISKEELLYMHENKTGKLIMASVVCGALLGGATKSEVDIIREYGKKLGLAFQVKDDLLDVIGETEKLGKKVKSDENNNKTNFITVYGIEKCKKICSDLTQECLELLDKLHYDVSDMKELTLDLLDREC